jgi:copper oxidase (laccase) domain-containing protein
MDLIEPERLGGQMRRESGAIHPDRGGICTVSNPYRLYSYRRDRTTGRLASLIWIRPTAA